RLRPSAPCQATLRYSHLSSKPPGPGCSHKTGCARNSGRSTPDITVMAPATQAGAEWVHVRPTPPTSTSPGNHPAGPSATPQIPEGSSSLPIIGRRLPASSSFVLAATPAPGAPAGPRTARRHKPATTRKSHNNSHPARRPENHTSPGQTTAPLDSNDPHGCTDAPPRDTLGAYLARPGGHQII